MEKAIQQEKITFDKIKLENLKVFGFPVQFFVDEVKFMEGITKVRDHLANTPVDREKKETLKLIESAMPSNKGNRGVWSKKYKAVLQESEATIRNMVQGVSEIDLPTLNRIASEACYEKEALKGFLLAIGKDIRLSDSEPYTSEYSDKFDMVYLLGSETDKLEYQSVQRNMATFGAKNMYEYLYNYLKLPNVGTTNYDKLKETVENIEVNRSNSAAAEVNKKNARDSMFTIVLKDEPHLVRYNNFLVNIEAEKSFTVIKKGDSVLKGEFESRRKLFMMSCEDQGLSGESAGIIFDYHAIVKKEVQVYDGLVATGSGGSGKSKSEMELQSKLAERNSKLADSEAKRMEKEVVLKEASLKEKQLDIKKTAQEVNRKVAEALKSNNYLLANELSLAHPDDISPDLLNQIFAALQMMERLSELVFDPTVSLVVKQKAIVCGIEDFGADPNNLVVSVLGAIKIKPCFQLRVQNTPKGNVVTAIFNEEDAEYIPNSLRNTYKLKVIRTFDKPALDVYEPGFTLPNTEFPNQFIDTEAIGDTEVYYTAFCSRLNVWSPGVSTSIRLYYPVNPNFIEQKVVPPYLVLNALLPQNCKSAFLKFEEAGFNTEIESVVLNYSTKKYWSSYESRDVDGKKVGFGTFELPLNVINHQKTTTVYITCLYLAKDNKRITSVYSKPVSYEISNYNSITKSIKTKGRIKLIVILVLIGIVGLFILLLGLTGGLNGIIDAFKNTFSK